LPPYELSLKFCKQLGLFAVLQSQLRIFDAAQEFIIIILFSPKKVQVSFEA